MSNTVLSTEKHVNKRKPSWILAFSGKDFAPPRAHLAMSGEIFNYSWGGGADSMSI